LDLTCYVLDSTINGMKLLRTLVSLLFQTRHLSWPQGAALDQWLFIISVLYTHGLLSGHFPVFK